MNSSTGEIKRIAILFTSLSGYTLACWKELKARYDVELLVFHKQPSKDAPFSLLLDEIDHRYIREDHSGEQIDRIISAFDPQGIVIGGWRDRDYMRVAKKFKAKGVTVVSSLDNKWRGDLRQQLAVAAAPFILHPSVDAIWGAGERQVQFAKKLGYTGSKCWHGYLCCDWSKFQHQPSPADQTGQNAFLYVGKYNLHEKALDVLVDAYGIYRKRAKVPWDLICAGTGEEKRLLAGQEGIVDLGFTQPDALPELMRQKASALILPSRKEAWGVVVQEAAASGLPLICSDICGATAHLLQDRYNGFVFESENAQHLASCMEQMACSSPSQLLEMGMRSYELSKQFTPERWADTLISGLTNLGGFGSVSRTSNVK